VLVGGRFAEYVPSRPQALVLTDHDDHAQQRRFIHGRDRERHVQNPSMPTLAANINIRWCVSAGQSGQCRVPLDVATLERSGEQKSRPVGVDRFEEGVTESVSFTRLREYSGHVRKINGNGLSAR